MRQWDLFPWWLLLYGLLLGLLWLRGAELLRVPAIVATVAVLGAPLIASIFSALICKGSGCLAYLAVAACWLMLLPLFAIVPIAVTFLRPARRKG